MLNQHWSGLYSLHRTMRMVLVELAEAKMYASNNPMISTDVKEMLERALLLDPDQQKGLWLLGIAASQSGNDVLAIELWERLAPQLDPATGVASSLQKQIAQARTRLGEEPATSWPGILIQVKLEDPGFEASTGAVLFIIARKPAGAWSTAGSSTLLTTRFSR